MASTSRQSLYSLSADHVPDWLSDAPLNFGEFLRPPSYLIASLQEAFDEFSYEHEPPTYDHSVATSSSRSQRRTSVACESIWEDDDDETGSDDESSDDADDELESETETQDRHNHHEDTDIKSGGEQTMLDESIAEDPSTPTSSNTLPLRPHLTPPTSPTKGRDFSSRPLPPLPHIAPPPYHLLHLHHLMPAEKTYQDPYPTLTACLATLDPALLLTPFAVFAEVCYEASVRGDTSPAPQRPFSPPPLLNPIPSSSTTRAVEDEYETTDDETMLVSPTQTFSSFGAVQPLIWDHRVEVHSRSASDLPIRMPRSMSPVSPFMSQDALASPISDDSSFRRARTVKFAHPDPMTEVASLFLHTSKATGAQDTVHGFPTRPEKSSRRSRSLSRSQSGTSTMRNFLKRSLNISQPRWVAV